MQTNEQLIRLVCLGCQVRLDDLFKPVREEVAKLGYVGANRSAACLVPELEPCPPSGVIGLALDVLAVAFAVRLAAPDVASVASHPAVAVLDRIDGSFAAAAPGHAASSSATLRRMYSSTHSGRILR